jgi:hypothetical protein
MGDRELFDQLTASIKLAIKQALEKIKNSSDLVIAICKDGKYY